MQSRDLAIGRAFRLHRRDRARAVRALAWLMAADAAVRLLPFAILSRIIARIPASRSPRAAITAADCTDAVRRAARIFPTAARCLPQAIAGYCLLRRAGRTGIVTLGVRVENARLDAHAWLECDGIRITGSGAAGQYAPLPQSGRQP